MMSFGSFDEGLTIVWSSTNGASKGHKSYRSTCVSKKETVTRTTKFEDSRLCRKYSILLALKYYNHTRKEQVAILNNALIQERKKERDRNEIV